LLTAVLGLTQNVAIHPSFSDYSVVLESIHKTLSSFLKMPGCPRNGQRLDALALPKKVMFSLCLLVGFVCLLTRLAYSKRCGQILMM